MIPKLTRLKNERNEKYDGAESSGFFLSAQQKKIVNQKLNIQVLFLRENTQVFRFSYFLNIFSFFLGKKTSKECRRTHNGMF